MVGGSSVPILEATGLCKTFDERDRIVLDGISLVAGRDETIAVMGPSGCGKTTLLSILAGLMEADAGTLCYRLPGVSPVGRLTPALRRDHVGIVFQSIHLIPTLTVIENVEIPMFGVESSRSRRIERAGQVLEILDLSALAHKQPHLLSGGERQRVAVARAFANSPSLVFADEPTGNLDTASSDRIVKALLDMTAETGGVLVVVTHNPVVAGRMHRILAIADGHIVEQEPIAPDGGR